MKCARPQVHNFVELLLSESCSSKLFSWFVCYITAALIKNSKQWFILTFLPLFTYAWKNKSMLQYTIYLLKYHTPNYLYIRYLIYPMYLFTKYIFNIKPLSYVLKEHAIYCMPWLLKHLTCQYISMCKINDVVLLLLTAKIERCKLVEMIYL